MIIDWSYSNIHHTSDEMYLRSLISFPIQTIFQRHHLCDDLYTRRFMRQHYHKRTEPFSYRLLSLPLLSIFFIFSSILHNTPVPQCFVFKERSQKGSQDQHRRSINNSYPVESANATRSRIDGYVSCWLCNSGSESGPILLPMYDARSFCSLQREYLHC